MPDYGDRDPDTGRTSARTEFEGTLDQNAPSVLNGQITPAQWAEYQSRRKRDAILGVLGVLGGATGLGALGGAISGAGAASGAASSAGGSLAPIAGGAPWAVTPYAGSATMVGTGLGAGAGAGIGGSLGGALGGMSARDLRALGLSLGGTVGAMTQDQPNMNPNTQTSDPNLQALMRSMRGRLDKSEPLYDSVLAMANGLLPTHYQKGGGGMR